MLKKVIYGCITAMAMMLVVKIANSACIWAVYQPEFSVEATRYKK